ncbi:ABC transporter permease [Paenibacillus sp. Y412MC10]|uniref:ABC transporter permease n=1 Tax=Geobacillus sp. (strain Y412MC10) TaxID=481743 RepID=UPI0001788B77|nr:ABC transporter permease [Paenibacillus sp. Y412MC10]ACX62685.1 ABC-2 type transporter [Paenibacillus sp. Y412MC10]
MTFSMKRLQAIINKEWKDSIRNPQILLMMGMPIMFAFLFSKMGSGGTKGDDMMILSFPILLALSMTGAFVLAMMVAEEKEKHTLRVLMLSPASTTEILMGKSFLTFVLTLIAVIASVAVSEVPEVNWGIPSLLILVSLVMFIALGLIIGLMSRTVQESSIIGLPVLIIFVMGPMFAPMLGNEWIMSIVDYLPTQKFIDVMGSVSQGAAISEMTQDLLICAGWTVISIVAATAVYSRKRFDR